MTIRCLLRDRDMAEDIGFTAFIYMRLVKDCATLIFLEIQYQLLGGKSL